MAAKAKKPPREGFRRRVNPYYGNMKPNEIAADIAKTVSRWLIFTVLAFVYWLAMLLLFSIILLNVWKTDIVNILLWCVILTAVSALIYGYILIHRKLYY